MSRTLDALFEAWRSQRFEPGGRNVLAADAAAIDRHAAVETYATWSAFVDSPHFGSMDEGALHVGLLPMPYLGDLANARVFLVTLNPGLGAHDYFGEHEVPAYREMLLANLAQSGDLRFPFLDPTQSWHGGSAYWSPRLRGITRRVREARGGSVRAALDVCARHIAVLELVPYHSESFVLGRRAIDALESTRLVRDFVFEDLLPRHRRGDCKLIVLRSRDHWLRPGDDARDFPMAVMPRNALIAETDAAEAAATICRFA